MAILALPFDNSHKIYEDLPLAKAVAAMITDICFKDGRLPRATFVGIGSTPTTSFPLWARQLADTVPT
jgi:hypothetical protein